MTYTIDRVWYGGHGYQNAWSYQSSTAGTLPCIVYFPGGGWAGAQREAWEVEAIWSQGLNNADGDYAGDYHVFVVNCASVGYASQLITFNAPWATSTSYSVGNFVWNDDGRYQCRDAHTSAAATEPGVGASWETVWHRMGKGTRPWADATAYVEEDYVNNDGNYWQCIDAHTSASATDEPGSGSAWELKWREVGPNEPAYSQAEDGFETTPGFLDQSITDVQQFMGWLKRNASTYNVDPDRIILAGSSAGGQRAACAAFQYALPHAYQGSPYSANVDAALEDHWPKALYLSISPTDFTPHTIAGLAPGLFGRSLNNAQMVALSNHERSAVSAVKILERTGVAMPTYLQYAGSYHGDGNSPPYGNSTWIYHHADNGWALFNKLTSARPDGLGRSDCVHLETDPSGGFRKYSVYEGTATNIGSAAKDIADDFFAWAAINV